MKKICELWEAKCSATMFGGCSGSKRLGSSFRGTEFGPHTLFRHVDLGQCQFIATNVPDVEFVVVKWAEQPCGLLFRRLHPGLLRWSEKHFRCLHEFLINRPFKAHTMRSALRDEFQTDQEENDPNHLSEASTHAKVSERREELSELYRELRIAYSEEGDSQMTRDFYFGELEAERLSLPTRGQRFFNLSHLYKWFSGYSKREGLALSWLLAFLFLIFPLCYFVFLNLPEHLVLSKLPPAISKDGKSICHSEPGLGRGPEVITRADDDVWGARGMIGILSATGSSLQASAFLPPSNQAGEIQDAINVLAATQCGDSVSQQTYRRNAGRLHFEEILRRVIQAFERLVVAGQLGLFLLALRSKFQRSL